MKTISPSTTSKLPDQVTAGEVYMTTVLGGEEAPQVRMARMYFAPGSRTAWHSHTGGEYLHILEGTALIQERDGDITTLKAGDTVFTKPNVEHWHGAPSDGFMAHLAIWGAPAVGDDEAETKWGPQVTDEAAEVSGKDNSKNKKDNE